MTETHPPQITRWYHGFLVRVRQRQQVAFDCTASALTDRPEWEASIVCDIHMDHYDTTVSDTSAEHAYAAAVARINQLALEIVTAAAKHGHAPA